jgi:beta-lactamase regulating signal transducer with metallopeptidase domain
MIALLLFSGIAMSVVWFAGRKDSALDPGLTTLVLGLLVVFPLLVFALPKIEVLPDAAALLTGHSVFPWMVVIAAVWAVGWLVSMVKLAMTGWGISRWRSRSRLIERRGGVEVRSLDELAGPVAAGVLRKVIFVPAGFEEWPLPAREMVMKHELAHHRRRDPLRRWVAELALAVHWFNPLVRWIVRRLLIQCEFACDEAVLNDGVTAENYANLLCDLAGGNRHRGPVLAMAERPGLESRVKRMLTSPGGHQAVWVKWLIGFIVTAALLLAMTGVKQSLGFSRDEIELRRSADPFPGR